ncbi:MAG TPA: endonuclease/exonuclease/phosphatase family protein, partial [Phycisphaerae bacterium]|nr:endonuclease/exonuclease/phosphatase family protein [Phycisphaerae bacterium]
ATQNIWGRTPLWPLRKRALARALHEADIVLLQEVHARGTRSQAHELADRMGLPHAHFVSVGRTLWWREGVAVISRWPIIHTASQKLPQSRLNPVDRFAPRAVFRAVIQSPAGNLEIYVLHLSLSRSARIRASRSIPDFVTQQRRIVPADFSVIGGDFNASHHEPCVLKLQTHCGVQDVHRGGDATFPAYWPHRRIDYLLASPNLRIRNVERRASCGSDHCGLIAHVDCN